LTYYLANATGVYSGYSATLGGGGPSGGAPPAMGGGGMGVSPLIRNETFLRGGYVTNSNGVVEITTIYPGYYSGRTAHIHTMVHQHWTKADNG